MNKNRSPQSRSSSRPRAQVRGHGERVGHADRSAPAARRERRDSAQRIKGAETARAQARRASGPTTPLGRLRRMSAVVAVPNLVVVLGILVVALAALLLSSSPMAWLPTIVGEAWMVFNLAPIRAGGIDLGIVPALPALLLAWLVGRRVRAAVKDKVSINDLMVLAACVFAVPFVLTSIAWFMLWDAGKVYDVSPPGYLSVLPRMLLLHAAALVYGMGTRLWKALAKRSGVPRVLVDAARIGFNYLGALCAVGLVLTLILWVAGWSRQSEMLASYPHLDALGTVGLVLISLCYLPNAAVSAAAVLSGSELHVGPDTSVSLFSGHMTPLPPLPLMAAIPPSVSPWAIALFVVPGLAAVYVFARQRSRVTFTVAAVATVACALAALVVVFAASGELGIYGYTGPEILSAVGLIALWCLVAGAGFAAANALTAWRARRAAAMEEDEEESEPADASAHEPEPAAAVPASEADAAEVIDAETDDAESDDAETDHAEDDAEIVEPHADGTDGTEGTEDADEAVDADEASEGETAAAAVPVSHMVAAEVDTDADTEDDTAADTDVGIEDDEEASEKVPESEEKDT